MHRFSAFIFPLVLFSLIIGILGGWMRLGWIPVNLPAAASNHGLLMTGGFLGSLIALERSMVMKHRLWLLVPFISGFSVILFLSGNVQGGMYALVFAAAGLSLVLYLQAAKHKIDNQWILFLGGLLWLIGNILVLKTGLIAAATPWWIGFILFTICGERLEMTKFLPHPKWAKPLFYALMALFLIGINISFHGPGRLGMGIASIGMALWLMKFDMAKISMRKSGQHKYIGTGLMVGYFWFLFFGIILCFIPHHANFYDLFLHSFFLGFAFSMIWAHAPIILPAVLNVKAELYHPILWIGWWLFQLSLAVRIISTFTGSQPFRFWSAIINGWTILMIFVTMAVLIWRRYRIVNSR